MKNPSIAYHLPTVTGGELLHLTQALQGPRLSGEGVYGEKVKSFLEKMFEAKLVVLTPSCTSALEMAMILSDVNPGDEVILPSFTFSSTALAVVSRNATPVFVDVRKDDLNLNINMVRQALTPKTKMILPVHYAGVSADMVGLRALAQEKNLVLLEDAAQALYSKSGSAWVGTQGDLSAFSFHDTKNITCGEGGALVINSSRYVSRAEQVRDKGTNRRQFLNGIVDKYTWVDEGSSFLMSELQAAYLWAQLEHGLDVTTRRLQLWQRYAQALGPLEKAGHLTFPKYDPENQGNGHLFFCLLNTPEDRQKLQAYLYNKNIGAIPHYQALHSSPAGQKFGRVGSAMDVTDNIVPRLLRLPLHTSLSDELQDIVIKEIFKFFNETP